MGVFDRGSDNWGKWMRNIMLHKNKITESKGSIAGVILTNDLQ